MRDSLMIDPPILNGRILEDELQKNISNEESLLSLNGPPVSLKKNDTNFFIHLKTFFF
jgi:hypothetical protein